MKNLLTILLALTISLAKAQDYQCLQSGVQHHFINNQGYMRGIRIDAKTGSGADSVFHPFRTFRHHGTSSSFDSSDGCWLGKNVIKQADGTFFFDNIFGDTVIIKTQAGLGTSWAFYGSDTAANYVATVTALDTMTVLGALDSIKKITITAYMGSTANPTDSINNFELVLSKNHGFVQVFDLFTFPYHRPGSPYTTGFDGYLDNVCYTTSGLAFPGINNSIFRIVAYRNPTLLELYDLHPGDAYCSGSNQIYQLALTYNSNSYDSVISKTVVDAWHVQFTTRNITCRTNYYYPAMAAPYFTTSTSYGTSALVADTSLAISFTQMPEEMGLMYDWYYLPNDSSRGFISPYYKVRTTRARDVGEMCHYNSEYKKGFPQLAYHICATSSGASFPNDIETSYGLGYSLKNGIAFGSSCEAAMAVEDVDKGITQRTYPNPASTTLSVQTGYTQPYTISLTNIMGATVITQVATKATEEVDIHALQNGLYTITTIDANGYRVNEKVVVTH